MAIVPIQVVPPQTTVNAWLDIHVRTLVVGVTAVVGEPDTVENGLSVVIV